MTKKFGVAIPESRRSREAGESGGLEFCTSMGKRMGRLLMKNKLSLNQYSSHIEALEDEILSYKFDSKYSIISMFRIKMRIGAQSAMFCFGT